jgi:transcriptional regulator with XRE-family HTH domain
MVLVYTTGMDAAELMRRRLALGLSRPALARSLGVAPSTVWRWELGKGERHYVMDRHLETTLRQLERRHTGAGGGR